MKILYLQLKNFASIYVAMRKKKIEIDFTKSKNQIILLVGKNGSGKTSILSALHPFAYPGNMDVRNNTNLILDGEDGYKEIIIEFNENTYRIQHFYKYSKKQVLLKSFIQKNGEELNPNGNVRSFNDVVKIELSLEQDYLKLIRLGSNVTNLIEMKSAERKNFASDLLSDINVYTELYKKINDDARMLKGLLKAVADKIAKLNVVDSELLNKEISDISLKLEQLTTEKENLQHKIGIIDGKISVILPDGVDTHISMIDSMAEDIQMIKNDLAVLQKEKSSIPIVLSSGIDAYIDKVRDDKRITQLAIDGNLAKLMVYKEQLNEKYNTKDDLNAKLKYLTSDLEYAQLTSLNIELTKKHEAYSKKFASGAPTETKDNVLLMLNLLMEMNNIANNIYEFDNSAVTEFVKLVKSGVNIDDFVKSEIVKIDRKISSMNLKDKSDFVENNVTILFRPDGCTFDTCPYYDLYKRMFTTDDNKSQKDDSVETLTRRRHNIEMLLDINRNYEYILMILKSNSSLISKSNIRYFRIENIISSLESRCDLYDENVITNYIAEIEEYEEFLSIESKLKEIKYELSIISANKSNIDDLQSKISEITNSIITTEGIIYELESEIKTDEPLIEYYNNAEKSAIRFKEIESSIDDLVARIDTMEHTKKSMEEKLLSAQSLIVDRQRINETLTHVVWEIDQHNKEVFNKRFVLKEFDSLSDERNVLNNKFDDINIIREALSSNKGIPLLFIQLYLKNSKIYVNQLLEMVYGDTFEIDDFEINSSEFNIPYIKNGIRINDVVYASQGERSFLSLALSFALIIQSIKDYNILLLDEIDSTLDTRNRSMFLNILEKQMDIINSEQVFLITHNNMFDNYPVDIILTSDVELDNYKNANVIYSV